MVERYMYMGQVFGNVGKKIEKLRRVENCQIDGHVGNL